MECARLLLLVVAIVVQFCGSKSCLGEEKRALLDIKDYMKFHNASVGSNLLPSWVRDTNSNCCDWERVTCDPYSGQVSHLFLHNVTGYDSLNYRSGYCLSYAYSLNVSLFLSFKHLKSLNLSYNCFDGLIEIQDLRSKSAFTTLEKLDLTYTFLSNQSIIESLSPFTSLKNLILAHCSIYGPFLVQELSLLQNLELLDLSYNDLTSPSIFQDKHSLSKLNKLRQLNLNGNNFDSNIFKPLVPLLALELLLLSQNSINGSLYDKGLCNMKQLQKLNLSQNWLTGSLDACLGNLTSLWVLDLSSNSLNGSLDGKVLCNMKQLEELDLSNNRLTGSLDACICNLTSLRALDLSNNILNGTIPASFFAPLASLKSLLLSNNNFEGLFSLNSLANNSKLKVLSLGKMSNTKAFRVETENPPWIPSFQLEFLCISSCNMSSRTIPTFVYYQHGLQHIDLSYNNLVGMFPNWLFVNNSKLKAALLNGNSFTGLFQLPFDLKEPLDQLLYLDLSTNKIQGKLPNSMGYLLPHLEYLNVSSNMFDGEIPPSIGEMSGLKTLDLSSNNFSGKIPKQILCDCILLETLRLSNNRLQGHIFPTPINLRFLKILMMDNNQFNGTLQDGLLFIDLRVLDISSNNLTGLLPSWIAKSPPSILSVSRNNFEGALPKDWCKNNLVLIDMSQNRFSGAIPSCLFTSHLRYIRLQGNNLTGTIPKEISRNSALVIVDLRDNKFSGSIPDSTYELLSLRFLLLAGNVLEGQLSSQICKLQEINILDLSRNYFTGSIPSCFNNMSFGKEISSLPDLFDLYEDFVGGPLLLHNFHPQIKTGYYYDYFSYDGREEVQFMTKSLSESYQGSVLDMMSGLDLSSNQLTGEIPHQISDLPTLRALNLSHNHLNGFIPKSFHKLKQIESLDLSNNNLKGEIPHQLQELNYLSIFNVSYNNLSGRAPENGQFANFDESNYKGNPYLSWSNSNRVNATLPSPQTPLNETKKSESVVDFTIFYWSFGASYVMVLITIVIILWINPHWRRVWFYYINICLQRFFGLFFEDAFF